MSIPTVNCCDETAISSLFKSVWVESEIKHTRWIFKPRFIVITMRGLAIYRTSKVDGGVLMWIYVWGCCSLRITTLPAVRGLEKKQRNTVKASYLCQRRMTLSTMWSLNCWFHSCRHCTVSSNVYLLNPNVAKVVWKSTNNGRSIQSTLVSAKMSLC